MGYLFAPETTGASIPTVTPVPAATETDRAAVGFGDLIRSGASSGPWLVALAMVTVTAVALPLGSSVIGTSVSFVPAMSGIITVFNLMTIYLLVGDYRDRGDPRLLAMAGSYVWCLVLMVANALAFPGAVAADPPLAVVPSMAPYFYLGWHGGFTLLLALAWSPWPHRWTRATPTHARALTMWVAISAMGVLALVTVVALLSFATRLPTLIVGRDTLRMTTLMAPILIPVAALSLMVTLRGMRGRTGPERWAAVVGLVCLCDLILTFAAHNWFSLGWYVGRSMSVLAAGMVLLAMQRQMRTLKARAEWDARVDVLTGLNNRREAYARLPQMVALATRRGTSLGVVSFDLDWFKTINDRFGHDVGDRVLSEVGRVLTANSRLYDLAARMGGEEFLLVLDDADELGTAVVAERLRQRISQIQIGGLDHPVTASFGAVVVSGADLADPPTFLGWADRALYEAKANGRNRVEVSDETSATAAPRSPDQ